MKNMQKNAIRTIRRPQYNSHTEPLFTNSDNLGVGDLYDSEITLFMHDYTDYKLPSSFDTFKRKIQESHQTRQSNLHVLFVERSKSVFANVCVIYEYITIHGLTKSTQPHASK